MPVADKVTVELEARYGRYRDEVTNLRGHFDRSMTSMERSAARMEQRTSASVAAMSTALRGAAVAFAAGFSLQAAQAVVDTYTRFTNQLRLAGLEGVRLADVQQNLFRQAQAAGAELEPLGQLYSRLSQSATDLGASQGQLLQFTEGVTNALRIQGGSTAAASGALLQLSQALGGAVVRAEEFNSINEGARPILQAVANGSDRFKGSVTALRAAVIDGKVSSQEFFQAFLVGSAQLRDQAGNATLTLAQNWQVLQNALVMSVGQMDETLGASQRLGEGIRYLADNLEGLGAAAALIAIAVGGRFVGAMGAAAVASSANAAAQARASIAATQYAAIQARMAGLGGAASVSQATLAANVSRTAIAMNLASGAAVRFGASLNALVGGPAGLAIAALAITVGGLAMEAMEAAADVDTLTSATADAATAMRDSQTAAGGASTGAADVGERSMAAVLGIRAFAGEVGVAAQRLWDMAAAAKAASVNALMARAAQLRTQREEVEARLPQNRRADMNRPLRSPQDAARTIGRWASGEARNIWTNGEADREAERAVAASRRQEQALLDEARRQAGLPLERFNNPMRPGQAAEGGQGGRGKKGPDPAVAARRAEAQAERADDRRRALEALREEAQVQALRISGRHQEAEALERVQRTHELINRYQNLGLTLAQATAAATSDMAGVAAAEATARQQAVAAMREDAQINAAQLAGNERQVTLLEDARFLREQSLAYQREMVSQAEAERMAQEDLLAIQNARAEAQARQLAVSEEQRQIDLAEARGDSRGARNLRRQQSTRERAEELTRGGMDPREAEAQAHVEALEMARAQMQGQIADVLRGSWQALLDGDVFGFLEDRLNQIGAHMFDEGINWLAEQLTDIVQNFLASMAQNSGGGGEGGGWVNNAISAVGSWLGGAKAGGGKVYPGMAYKVNENTPRSEWFVPQQHGTIVPANDLQRGAGAGRTEINLRVINGLGVPASASVTQDPNGDMRLDLQPMVREGLNSAARDGTLSRASRHQKQPTRRA